MAVAVRAEKQTLEPPLEAVASADPLAAVSEGPWLWRMAGGPALVQVALITDLQAAWAEEDARSAPRRGLRAYFRRLARRFADALIISQITGDE